MATGLTTVSPTGRQTPRPDTEGFNLPDLQCQAHRFVE